MPEAEQLRRYAVLHQKHKQPLFDIFMELGGAPHGLPPALLPPSRLPLARPSARLPWLSLSYTCRQSHGQSHGQSHRQSHCQSHCCCCCCCCTRDAGFYYKTGQKIASNTGGVVPKVYSDRFQPFLNDIPPRPEAAVREVIEAELGRPMGEVISSFTT